MQNSPQKRAKLNIERFGSNFYLSDKTIILLISLLAKKMQNFLVLKKKIHIFVANYV